MNDESFIWDESSEFETDGAFPTWDEFNEFTALCREIDVEFISDGKSVKTSSWVFTNPELFESIKQHSVYKFLASHPLFQWITKLLQRVTFKNAAYCKKFRVTETTDNKAFFDEVGLRIMQITAVSSLRYLEERQKGIPITVSKSDKDDVIKLYTDALTVTERLKFALSNFDLSVLSGQLNNVLSYMQNDVPWMFAEKKKGDYVARMLVFRICDQYYMQFREIDVAIIRHMANIILRHDDTEISNELIDEWIDNNKVKIQNSVNTGLSIYETENI